MGEEAEHLRHRQRVGVPQVELRAGAGTPGSTARAASSHSSIGSGDSAAHSTDPPLTPRTWPVM